VIEYFSKSICESIGERMITQTKEEFLDSKKDYSPFLVHLTKGTKEKPPKIILEDILTQHTLKALNYHCFLMNNLKNASTQIQNKYKVVCFSETTIDQVSKLTEEISGRWYSLAPYGLIFTKDFIRGKGGNPAIYVTWPFSDQFRLLMNNGNSDQTHKLLALVNICDEGNDWHWEREWRIVGNLEFNLDDVFCGFCPDNEIAYFEEQYKPVRFLDPKWSIYRILDHLMQDRFIKMRPDSLPIGLSF
jgi:hypothetical protein